MQLITNAAHRDSVINVLEVIGNAGKGGMENYIASLITNLPSNQFRVTCICPYESLFTASLRRLGVEKVYITPMADDPPWRSILLTAEVARLHRIDVLHAHMPKAHVLSGVAGCLIRKPVVATIHGMHLTSHELSITRAVGSHLITNCQEAYVQALALGLSVERVALIQNGVDTTFFTPNTAGNVFRKLINIARGTPLVGFVGRLDHEKGPDLFLRAAEYVHHVRPDVHFVVVGDGAMRKQLVSMCAAFRLKQRVHFVDWSTNTADIYQALDLLVHTSRSDGTSLVLLEAMSCGCPVVALAVGGVPEIIENGSTGLLAGVNDWEGAAIQVLQLLDQPERRQGMGAAARARIEQQFNLETNTRRTAEVLRQVTLQGVNGHQFATNSKLDSGVLFNNSGVKKK